MFYIRRAGSKIKRWRIGLQRWHGLNIHFRTNKNIYVIGPKKGYGCQKIPYTKEDFLKFQAWFDNTTIKKLNTAVLDLW